MKTKDRLLEDCVDIIVSGETTVEECITRHFATDPEAANVLRTIVALRTVTLPALEVAAARERVGLRLNEFLTAAGTSEAPDDQTANLDTSARQIARRRQAPWRLYLIAAAVLLFSALGFWQALIAAGAALPESPLYGIKRGVEWVEVRSAWSDERHGTVLAGIASHRLAEARAEAAVHHDATVRSLATELDSTMSQLISLTASMQNKHEDTAVVALALAQSLHAEYVTLQAAQQANQNALAQALDQTVVMQQQSIRQNNLVLPTSDDGQTGSSAADPRGSSNRDDSPPGHSSHPATPPNAHGHNSHGGGNGRGNGGNGGMGGGAKNGSGSGGGSGAGGSGAGGSGSSGTGGSTGSTGGTGSTGSAGSGGSQAGPTTSIPVPGPIVVTPTSSAPVIVPGIPEQSIAPQSAGN